MNRSVERRQFEVVGVVPGEILVGRYFGHPDRGLVRCPAVSLVAAGVRRAGRRVREVSCLRPAACGGGEGDGVLFAASYLDQDGCAIGLSAAVHRADGSGLAAAREAILAWSALWRTRRVMVADIRNACSGRGYAGEVLSARRRRIGSAHDVRDRDRGSPTMRPHGRIPVGVTESAHDARVPERHASCSHAARAHAEAQRFADRGDYVVVIGKRGHAETSALLARAPERSVVVESEEDVAQLSLAGDQVSYLVQPGAAIEPAMAVLASLRRRYPSLRGAHPDHLCYTGSDQAETIRLVTATSDRTIVLGDPDVSTLCEMNASAVEVVRDPTLLRPAWLAGAECVGVIPASPSSGQLLAQLINLLSGLGPLSVIRRRVTTEPVPMAVTKA